MRTRREFIVLLSTAAAVRPSNGQDRPARILYFTHSAGYRHEVIPASQVVLQQIAAAEGFQITTSEDVTVFARELRRYGAIMFFTSGELPMSNAHRVAFTDFIRVGAASGVHSATDTFYQWPGISEDHWRLLRPSIPGIRRWSSRSQIVMTRWWPSWAKRLPSQMKSIRFAISTWAAHACCYASIRTSVDLTQPNVHRHPYGWPLAWTRSYGVGRVFYTALGHEEGVWRDPRFQMLLRNAALWVLRKPA